MECKHSGQSTLQFTATDYISEEYFAVRRCGVCGRAYTDISSVAVPIIDEAYYPSAYYGQQKRYSFLIGKLLDLLVMRRARLLGSKAKIVSGAVLDIGCGQGVFLKLFAQRGWRAVGIEASESAAWHAREVLGLDVHVGIEAYEKLEDSSFDVICLWHVLEHVDQPISVLKQAHRLLKSDGKLLLSVPNFGSVEARLGKSSWFHLDVPRHVTHFTEQALNECLVAAGWQIAQKTYFTPEYDFFSFIQTVQNLCGLEMNLLYRMLRREGLVKKRHGRAPFLQKILAFVSLPLLALAALVYVPIAITLGQGSSVNLVIEKKIC